MASCGVLWRAHHRAGDRQAQEGEGEDRHPAEPGADDARGHGACGRPDRDPEHHLDQLVIADTDALADPLNEDEARVARDPEADNAEEQGDRPRRQAEPRKAAALAGGRGAVHGDVLDAENAGQGENGQRRQHPEYAVLAEGRGEQGRDQEHRHRPGRDADIDHRKAAVGITLARHQHPDDDIDQGLAEPRREPRGDQHGGMVGEQGDGVAQRHQHQSQRDGRARI